MDAILKTEAFGQPLSILCMELCIKDLNEATLDFLDKHHKLVNFSRVPSWKFPYINIEKLDIISILQNYRELPENRHYQEILELLIDRLFFSITATCQLLRSQTPNNSSAAVANDNKISSAISPKHHHSGQGDSSYYLVPRLANKSGPSDDPQHIFGTLVKSLYETVTEVIQSRRSIVIPTVVGWKTARNPTEKEAIKINCHSSASQTEVSTGKSCETCFTAQNLLKFIANIVSECLQIISPEDPSIMINKFRKNEDALWTLSQQAFVLKWCTAIQQDCKKLVEKTSEILEQKSSLQKNFDEFDAKLKKEVQKKVLLKSKEFDIKLDAVQKELQEEKAAFQKIIEESQEKSVQIEQLESKLQIASEQYQLLEASLEKVSGSLEEINTSHTKLDESHCLLIDEKADLQDELDLKTRSLEKVEALLKAKDEEIETLNKTVEKLRRDEMTREEMKSVLDRAKKQLEACKKDEEEKKQARLLDKEKISKYAEEITMLKEQIELLTLYPDLNGPINPPAEDDSENPLKAMVNQVRSNKLRIEVLQSQTERLNATLAKYSGHDEL